MTGVQLYEWRLSRGLTQVDLANMWGIERKQVIRKEQMDEIPELWWYAVIGSDEILRDQGRK